MENSISCAFCDHVVEVQEWDSDRVIEWECALDNTVVEPNYCCKMFKRFNEDNEINDEEELY